MQHVVRIWKKKTYVVTKLLFRFCLYFTFRALGVESPHERAIIEQSLLWESIHIEPPEVLLFHTLCAIIWTYTPRLFLIDEREDCGQLEARDSKAAEIKLPPREVDNCCKHVSEALDDN